MLRRKIMVIAISALTLIALLVIAVPVVAADNTPPTTPAQITPANKPKVMVRLLLVQDEAKVDAFIAKAVDAGKITPDQAVKVKDFWTANHGKAAGYAKRMLLQRLLRVRDEAKVQAFLDKTVSAGKIQQAQADKVIRLWKSLHAPAPATAAQ
jgi:hypothetical protein